MASRPSSDRAQNLDPDQDPTALRPGMDLRESHDGADLHVTYVSDDTVVALTRSGMIAMPRTWLESDLQRGSVVADSD